MASQETRANLKATEAPVAIGQVLQTPSGTQIEQGNMRTDSLIAALQSESSRGPLYLATTVLLAKKVQREHIDKVFAMGGDQKNNRGMIKQAKGRQKLADSANLQVHVVNHDDEHWFFRQGSRRGRHTIGSEFDHVIDELIPLAIQTLPIADLLLTVENLLDESCFLWDLDPPDGRHTEQL